MKIKIIILSALMFIPAAAGASILSRAVPAGMQKDAIAVQKGITVTVTPVKIQNAWYSDSWKYRKSINVTAAADALTTQVFLSASDVGLSELVSGGKLNSDWSDLRFTIYDGTTTAYHWVVPSKDGVWVNLPYVDTGGNLIYMYYGNPSASDTSNFYNAMAVRADTSIIVLNWFDVKNATFALNSSYYGYFGRDHGNMYGTFQWEDIDCPMWGDAEVIPESGSALIFNGVDSHMQIPANVDLDSKDLTVAFWIKPAALDTYQKLICKTNYNQSWRLDVTNDSGSAGRLEFSTLGRTVICYTDNALTAGKWNHIAATFNSASKTMRVYVNGALKSSKTSVDTVGADVSALIQLSENVSYKGSFDELVIADRAYETSEIKGLYERRTPNSAVVSVSEPTEISSFKMPSRLIRPGDTVIFTYGFTEAMDTALTPVLYFWAVDGTRSSITGSWKDAYTYEASYSVPSDAKEGFTEVAIAGAWTKGGTAVGDYKKVIIIAGIALIAEEKTEFFPNPFSPNGDGFADKTTLFIKTDAASDVKITVYDIQGTVVRHLFKGDVNGVNSVDWDGKDNAGEPAQIGLYIYQVEIDNDITSGSIVLTR